jgi:hypothetical protein
MLHILYVDNQTNQDTAQERQEAVEPCLSWAYRRRHYIDNSRQFTVHTERKSHILPKQAF